MSDLFPHAPVDIDAQIQCARREVEMRERNYPKWVQRGMITQSKADRELLVMRAILNTLEAWKAEGRR